MTEVSQEQREFVAIILVRECAPSVFFPIFVNNTIKLTFLVFLMPANFFFMLNGWISLFAYKHRKLQLNAVMLIEAEALESLHRVFIKRIHRAKYRNLIHAGKL